MAAVTLHRGILVLALMACRVVPEHEEGRVDTASAHGDTQTIELAAPPRAAPVIADTLIALDNGDSIRRDTTNPPVPRETELSELDLIIPVAGVKAEDLLDTFNEMRGERRHDALDIPAPRGTPVLAATDGRVLRLFTSERGGLMIYTADASERFVLMYAHLDGYADGVSNDGPLRRGQVIGYVGTTGNAPPNLPHLHFAIARSSNVARWWEGTPVDPLPLLQGPQGPRGPQGPQGAKP
ncbi:MAG TPA: M23 family metallopeptidase [Gemmatimonadaceae bacterium]|nr:M23 family metallopeptidase [Gemmatimonadaceae bacterium]